MNIVALKNCAFQVPEYNKIIKSVTSYVYNKDPQNLLRLYDTELYSHSSNIFHTYYFLANFYIK